MGFGNVGHHHNIKSETVLSQNLKADLPGLSKAMARLKADKVTKSPPAPTSGRRQTPTPFPAESKSFSIIMPVYNEAKLLGTTIPNLLNGLADAAELIIICNGCSDDSAETARNLVGHRGRVIDIREKGKANAIRTAERTTTTFPRFFVDSDIMFKGSDFLSLIDALKQPGTLIVSPVAHFDTTECTWAARAISRIWVSLPYGGKEGIHGVIGVSGECRKLWGELPDTMADDSYMSSQVPAEGRRIVHAVVLTSRAPRTFWTYVRVRSRWLRGDQQLHDMGLQSVGSGGQKSALVKALINPRTTVDALVYTAHRLMAGVLAKIESKSPSTQWYTDNSSRK
jgi:Glycosyl transferase family 2